MQGPFVCLLVLLGIVGCSGSNAGWTRTVQACIRFHNDKIIENVADFDSCKTLCVQERSFICRAAEWRNSRCQMSRYGQYTLEDASDYSQPCYNGDNWLYAERTDLRNWSEPVDGCIWYNNVAIQLGVSNLEECREACLRQTFSCVSVDYRSGTCNLQSDYQQSITPSTNYTQPCYNGQPWKYTELLNPYSCIQQWTRTTRACIRGHNDKIIDNVVTSDACKSLCLQESTFQCASFDYKNGRCQLSRFSQFTLLNSVDFSQPCYIGQPWEYAERRDLEKWTRPVPGCISGNNNAIRTGVRDLQDCRQLCEQMSSFTCVAVEFKSGRCQLSSYGQHTLPQSSDYRRPCHVSGYIYTERLGTHSCIIY